MGAAMAVMLVGAACSKKSQTASSPPVVTTPPATSAVSPGPTPAAAITVQQTGGFRFKPATLTVKTGQQITAQNVDPNTRWPLLRSLPSSARLQGATNSQNLLERSRGRWPETIALPSLWFSRTH